MIELTTKVVQELMGTSILFLLATFMLAKSIYDGFQSDPGLF